MACNAMNGSLKLTSIDDVFVSDVFILLVGCEDGTLNDEVYART